MIPSFQAIAKLAMEGGIETMWVGLAEMDRRPLLKLSASTATDGRLYRLNVRTSVILVDRPVKNG